ncbi:MAG: hypothetical protein COX19_02095 [Desulfobacterales bacterium CG23_combo_of_CG06-09_8_20_14_all_51_8]|nr:MAG: hypothetical protein COX19_02095 [Desulfobacterales bacterium CG23_combo_of_CG06-09_8_20_14_all_51_8]
MLNPIIEKKIHSQLERLPFEKQIQVLDFARTLASKRIKGVPGQKLLRFAGAIENQDLDAISQAIDENCGKVNLHEW